MFPAKFNEKKCQKFTSHNGPLSRMRPTTKNSDGNTASSLNIIRASHGLGHHNTNSCNAIMFNFIALNLMKIPKSISIFCV